MKVRMLFALAGAVCLTTLGGAEAPQTSWILNRGPDAARARVDGGSGTCELGLFRVTPTSTDVTVTLPMRPTDAFPAAERPVFALRYRMKTRQRGGGLFFTTDTLTNLCDASFTSFPVQGDGQWHDQLVDMRKSPRGEWKGTVTSFRLDPTNPSDCESEIEVSRMGFFPDADAAGRFLAQADDTPDYAQELRLSGPNFRCIVPGGTLKPGWRRADFALASGPAPAGDGVLAVCRDGEPVPSAVSPRGFALYVADRPGAYALKRVPADRARALGPRPVPYWDRARFQIGAYFLHRAAHTADGVRAVRDCGIDFIVGVPVSDGPLLDLFVQEGVGAVVNGAFPGWWGGDGQEAGKMKDHNPLATYRTLAARFPDHPAIVAADIGDEPSALDFPHYRDVVESLRGWAPNLPLYLNLYPNYASVAENSGSQTMNQLGTPTYLEHVARYAAQVPLHYLSYDFYPYMNTAAANDRFRLKMWDNFRIVADSCRASGQDFWYIPQVNSRYPDLHMTENTLRFQAHAAMAFGAVSITWACYTGGWWTNNVLDVDGRVNPEYGRLRTVNAELRSLADDFMRYRNTATHFVGFAADEKLDTLGIPVRAALDAAGFAGVRAADGGPLLAGEMAARDGGAGRALFVLAADDMYDRRPLVRELRFRAPGRAVRVRDAKGVRPLVPDAAGVYALPLRSNAAVLLMAD